MTHQSRCGGESTDLGGRAVGGNPLGIAALLLLGLFVTYNANLRQVSSDDTRASRYVPLSILRQGNIELSEYFPDPRDSRRDSPLAYYLHERGTALYDSYPPVGPLLALPVYAPIVASGLVRDDYFLANLSSKLAGSVMTALAVAFLFLAMHRVLATPDWTAPSDPVRGALLATIVVGLATPLWSTASQALYTHAPVVLGLSASLYCLVTGRWKLAGFAAALACVARPTVTPAGALLLLYPALQPDSMEARRKASVRYLGAALLTGGPGLAYNLWMFGNLTGGARERTGFWLAVLDVDSMFDGALHTGLAGLLVNPSRGLLVHSPILILAFVGAWRAWRRPVEDARVPDAILLVRVSSLAALAVILVYAKFVAWWGGHGYGPKYLTDVMPLLGILLLAGLPSTALSSPRPRRAPRAVIWLLIGYSIAVQLIGVFCWPSSWTTAKDPPYYEHLWDWRHNQIVTCLRDGPRIDPAQRRVMEVLGIELE